MMLSRATQSCRNSRSRRAFTLVEILIVFLLMSILAAIALPTAKNMIGDQQVTRTARSITSYVDRVRNRAIAEGRPMGILIERVANLGDATGRAYSVRIRTMSGVPPYSGDSANSTVQLQIDGITAKFEPSENQLLALAASMKSSGATGDVDDLRSPIRDGDFIELPGGRLVPFTINYRDLTAADSVKVDLILDLRESDARGSKTFPSSSMSSMTVPRSVRYKIHRRPTVSSATPFTLPKGMAIDLNYSGVGIQGNQFAPDPVTTVTAYNIAIVFGADGKVISASQSSAGLGPPPSGKLFFCLGEIDGVRVDNLFSNESRAVSNVLNGDSIWLVINPSTGSIVSSPIASVSSIPAGTITDPYAAGVNTAIGESRLLANFSDTVDLE